MLAIIARCVLNFNVTYSSEGGTQFGSLGIARATVSKAQVEVVDSGLNVFVAMMHQLAQIIICLH